MQPTVVVPVQLHRGLVSVNAGNMSGAATHLRCPGSPGCKGKILRSEKFDQATSTGGCRIVRKATGFLIVGFGPQGCWTH